MLLPFTHDCNRGDCNKLMRTNTSCNLNMAQATQHNYC
jgi:hypothetical protein